jgi:hypothetical protein
MPLQASVSRPPAGPRGVIECRVYPRVECALPSSCQPASAVVSKEAQWSATIRNISLGGVSLNLERRFEPGTGLAIELPGVGGREGYTVLARVIHVNRQTDGSWSLGCQFVSALGEDEVQRLLPARGFESSPRTVLNVHWQLAIHTGAVFSYQIKSLQVPASWPVPAGKIVTLRGKGQGRRWSLKLKIASCRRQGGGWLVQCRLLTTPSAESLLEALSNLPCARSR